MRVLWDGHFNTKDNNKIILEKEGEKRRLA